MLLTASTTCLFFPGSWPCILDTVLCGKICQLNDPNQRFHRLGYGPYLMKGEESKIRTESCYGLPLSLDEEQEWLGNDWVSYALLIQCVSCTWVLTNLTHFRGIANEYVRLRNKGHNLCSEYHIVLGYKSVNYGHEPQTRSLLDCAARLRIAVRE